MVWFWERCWQDRPLAVTPDLSSLKGLHSTAHPQSAQGGFVEFLSPDFLAVIIVSHLQRNIASEKVLGATSYTWQPTKVIICPVFLSFCLSFKAGTGLCFCWSLPFSPCYWCAASFVLTAKEILDDCPACLQRLIQSLHSKVSGFFSNRRLPETRHLHAYEDLAVYWNFQRQRAWTWPLRGLQRYLKPLDKKMVSASATMKLSLNFILFILLVFHLAPIENV